MRFGVWGFGFRGINTEDLVGGEDNFATRFGLGFRV